MPYCSAHMLRMFWNTTLPYQQAVQVHRQLFSSRLASFRRKQNNSICSTLDGSCDKRCLNLGNGAMAAFLQQLSKSFFGFGLFQGNWFKKCTYRFIFSMDLCIQGTHVWFANCTILSPTKTKTVFLKPTNNYICELDSFHISNSI